MAQSTEIQITKFTALHLFAGIGGGALGLQQGGANWRGQVGRFETLAGIDSDPEACADFERLTGATAACLDLFSREQYRDFHGQEPPEGWQEVSPQKLRAAAGGRCPDVVFTSPPCKGFSGLLPKKAAKTVKYQALNELTVRSIALTLEAFEDDLPAAILLENVPRIATRGEALIDQIKKLLAAHGYAFHEGYHCCGEIGGLGQKRRRYLLIARNTKKVSPFIYQAPKRPLKTIGDVLGPLPLPDDSMAGPMHRLPRLKWRTWVRLALIPAGGDWRDLEKVAPGSLRIEHAPRPGVYQVGDWQKTAGAVVGAARVGGSNGLAAVADPRLKDSRLRYSNKFQVVNWEESAPCVTGTPDIQAGAPSVADPRLKQSTESFGGSPGLYGVIPWEKAAPTISGGAWPTRSNCPATVADPRLGCKPRGNTKGPLGVQPWDETASTVFGSQDIHAGAAAVADPRLPDDDERPDPPPVIAALDGSWHRPLTTLELAALQGFPTRLKDGSPLILEGKSDTRWRERIGNAVPPPAARSIADQIALALLQNELGETFVLGATDIWVKPENLGIFDPYQPLAHLQKTAHRANLKADFLGN